MSYLPLSQIITGSYTNGGEFKLIDSLNDPSSDSFITYIGPYLTTSKNEFYTGKNFTRSSKQLTKVFPARDKLQNPTNPSINSLSPIITVLNEDTLTSVTDGPLDNTIPNLLFSYYPEKVYNSRNIPSLYTYTLSKEQKKLHKFTRYFTKKTNELVYFEISKEDFNKLLSKDVSMASDLYIPISLQWEIKGNKQEIYKANKSTVTLLEQQSRLFGFSQIFKDNFTQFYLED